MTAPIDLRATQRCYCLAARKRARAITRLFDDRLRPHGLRSTQFSVLAVLSLRGPTSVGELAGLLGLERTTLTRSAALMERNGWIRAALSGDARRRPLALTESGQRTLEGAFPAWQEAQQIVESGWSGGSDGRPGAP
ncbi:MAG: MarR family transcriptional regulator [Dehalococcoidia bacterium]